MPTYRILVTGGAGFIGSHLVDSLVEKGHEVVVMDNLIEYVHGKTNKPPEYLNKNAEFIRGDIRKDITPGLLEDIDIIYHLAAAVGVGLSMRNIYDFTDIIAGGTANLLQKAVEYGHSLKKIILSSSNTVYGEGLYGCPDCGPIKKVRRSLSDLKKGIWEVPCPKCGKIMDPLPTPEDLPTDPTSVYAICKEVQEKLLINISEKYGLKYTILRFFLVYGSRQSLNNPYTGVCSIFASALMKGKRPVIFEDGRQTRDFVHVKDVCRALELCIEKPSSDNLIFNVGSGRRISIREVFDIIASYINPGVKPDIPGKYRFGDIRHCFPDISLICGKLGYKPRYGFGEGISEFIEYIRGVET